MRKELLDELMIISEEEKKYKSGQSTVEQSLYAKDNLTEIDRKRLLQRGKLITVRPHSRFVDFPEHRHNYVEMMYVVQGSITHYIEGKELVLRKGDVLMLNQHVSHAIKGLSMKILELILLHYRNFLKFHLRCCMRKCTG